MTELWLIALVPLFAWFLARIRRARAVAAAQSALDAVPKPQAVNPALGYSGDEMTDLVEDLSGDLCPSLRIADEIAGEDSSHTWNSPSGKKIYTN